MSRRDEDQLLLRLRADHQDLPHGKLSEARLRMHLAAHAVVERQLADDSLRVVGETLARLMGAGIDRHAAVHAIAAVALEEVTDVLQNGRGYDAVRYVAKLAALTPGDLAK